MKAIKKGKVGQFLIHREKEKFLGTITEVEKSYFFYRSSKSGEIINTALDFRWWIEENYEFVDEVPWVLDKTKE